MKKFVMAVSIVSVLLLGGWAGAANQPAVPHKQTLCPIEGGQVKTNLYVDALGKRVYFCCNGCPEEFKKDPAKYIAIMEKSGITLEQAPAAAVPAAPAQGHAAAAACGGDCCK